MPHYLSSAIESTQPGCPLPSRVRSTSVRASVQALLGSARLADFLLHVKERRIRRVPQDRVLQSSSGFLVE